MRDRWIDDALPEQSPSADFVSRLRDDLHHSWEHDVVAARAQADTGAGRRRVGWMVSAVAVAAVLAILVAVDLNPDHSSDGVIVVPATETPSTETDLATTTPSSATSSPGPSPTSTELSTTTTDAASTTAVASTSGTVEEPDPLRFVDGRFLGLREGSVLADAVAALAVQPVPISSLADQPPIPVCPSLGALVVRSGGLLLYFEGSSPENAVLMNWSYDGGPVGGYSEMIAPNGIKIGDSRDQLLAASPSFADFVDQIDVADPVPLRFGIVNDRVAWFGVVNCGD